MVACVEAAGDACHLRRAFLTRHHYSDDESAPFNDEDFGRITQPSGLGVLARKPNAQDSSIQPFIQVR